MDRENNLLFNAAHEVKFLLQLEVLNVLCAKYFSFSGPTGLYLYIIIYFERFDNKNY